MPNNQEKVTISDILGETQEHYLTDLDMKLLRDTFKQNPRLLRVLRKVFLPTVSDPELPPEEINQDPWLAGREWSQIPAEEAKILICAREEMVKWTANALIRLKVIANQPVESDKQQENRRAKDSTK